MVIEHEREISNNDTFKSVVTIRLLFVRQRYVRTPTHIVFYVRPHTDGVLRHVIAGWRLGLSGCAAVQSTSQHRCASALNPGLTHSTHCTLTSSSSSAVGVSSVGYILF